MGSTVRGPMRGYATGGRRLPDLSRRGFLTLLGLGGLAACTGPVQLDLSLPKRSLYYGAGMPPENLPAFEERLGEPLPCYRSFFVAGQEADLAARVDSDARSGRMSITSIKPPSRWAVAANDTAWIHRVLEPLASIDRNVFLAVHHEPENDLAAFGTSDDYLALQNAFLARARDIAPRVVIVPILSTWSFDERSGRSPHEWNVPDAPVYGLDLYNPWSPTNGSEWVSFGEKLALAEKDAAGRPIVIGEYGCRSDPANPGRAAHWMRDALEVALDSSVIAMAYFNSSRGATDGTWELDDETYPVFAELVGRRTVARIEASPA